MNILNIKNLYRRKDSWRYIYIYIYIERERERWVQVTLDITLNNVILPNNLLLN